MLYDDEDQNIINLEHRIKYYQKGLETATDETEIEELLSIINNLQHKLNWELKEVGWLNYYAREFCKLK